MTGPTQSSNPLPPAPVQLRDVFPVTLSGKLYPLPPEQIQTDGQANAQVSRPTIFPSEPLAQVQLTAKVISGQEPLLFEIEVEIVGVFEQTGELPVGYTLVSYLEATAFALLMPFLRTFVFEMGMRLRIGPILLPVVTPSLIPSSTAPSSSQNLTSEKPEESAKESPRSRRRPPHQKP